MWELWNRVVTNWKTSAPAITAGAIIVAQWYGWIAAPEKVITVMAAIEALILLFAKDK